MSEGTAAQGFEPGRGGPSGDSRVRADFVVRRVGELVTLAPAAVDGRRGARPRVAERDDGLGVLREGALAARDGRIVWVGREAQLGAAVELLDGAAELDAAGACVLPGFVDAHTHAVFAGSRANEYAARLGGVSYATILASGGGINATVAATRAASLDELTATTRSASTRSSPTAPPASRSRAATASPPSKRRRCWRRRRRVIRPAAASPCSGRTSRRPSSAGATTSSSTSSATRCCRR